MPSIRTRTAQAVYWLGGQLSRVKTPRRTHRLVSTRPLVTEPADVRWLSCRTSIRLLELSERIDPEHWDHWALMHPEECSGGRCAECGGAICSGRGETEHCADDQGESV